MKTLHSAVIDSPLGGIAVVADEEALVFLDFAHNEARQQQLLERRFGAVRLRQQNDPLAMRQHLERYFAGVQDAFAGVHFSTGGTDFQQRVWQALRAIPWGRAISYHALAVDTGNPKAVRAVASANARNPIALLIPCHRVIGKNGSLRGYAGGIERKAWLLRHEKAII